MPSNTPIVARLQKVGIAKETTWGTAAATPAYTLRVKDVKAETNVKFVKDEGMRGVNAKTFDVYDGTHEGSIDLDVEVFPEDFPLFLKAILGSETVTGAATPYSHAFALANTAQPPSLTFFHDTGFEVRVYAGCMVESVQLKWAKDAGLEASIKMSSKPFVVGTQWVPSFATTSQWIGWQTAVTIGGTANQKLVGFDITWKRALYIQHAANNTQAPTAIISQDIEVTGKATFDINDDTELNYMLNNTKPAFLFTMTQPGANGPVLTIQMSKCAFMKDSESGKSVFEGDTSWEAIANPTDALGGTGLSPCQVTIQNAVTTAY